MSRNRAKPLRMPLTSLMDVFTILVFFLLVNSANTEVLETPKRIELPQSVVEQKPRETVVIFVSPEEITVQGEIVARLDDVAAGGRRDRARNRGAPRRRRGFRDRPAHANGRREPGGDHPRGSERALRDREEGDGDLYCERLRADLARRDAEGVADVLRILVA